MSSPTTMSGPFSVFYGAVVTPVDVSTWKAMPRCLLAVDSSGNIAWMIEHLEESTIPEVLAQKGQSTTQLVILRKGEFIIPGFIDTHTHAPQFPNLGLGGEYELPEWLKEVVFPREAQFKDTELAGRVCHEVVRRTLDYGTTTSCYYSSLHLAATIRLADATHKLGKSSAIGQRAFIGKCNMDRKKENPEYYVEKDFETSRDETLTLISYIRNLSPAPCPESAEHRHGHGHGHGHVREPLVQPILTPRFAISCTSEMLYALRDVADDHDREYPHEPRMRIQTHIAENLEEVKRVHELYPKADSYADVYDHHGVLRDTTVLAHAVHLKRDEIELIKKRNAGISHCPSSNFYLTSGIAPVGRYLDAGIKVGLGTDVGGGYSLSMLNVIQNASIASKLLSRKHKTHALQTESLSPGDDDQPASAPPTPPSEPTSTCHKKHFTNSKLRIPTLFYLATLGGAEVCNLSHKTGSFCPGKSFDALLVSVLDETGATGLWGNEAALDNMIPEKKLEENLERFLFCGDDRNILKVWVQGRLVGGKQFHG